MRKDTHNKLADVYSVLTKLSDQIVERMFKPAGMGVGNFGLVIGRQKNAYGYCYVSENWKVKEDGVREIGLTPDALKSGEQQVCNTLAHELVHAYNAENNIKDVSGKRHNKRFKAGCEKIGLGCEYIGTRIGFTTDPKFNDDACREMFESILSTLSVEERFLLNNLSALLEEEKPKSKNRNLPLHVCPMCGGKARARANMYLICGDCKVDMLVQE